MFEKIDNLQAEVNDLLELCADAGVEVDPVGPEESKRQRLYVLILKMQDGALHPRYVHRLQQWLACDRRALTDYVDFQHLTVLLKEHYNPGFLTRTLNFLKDCLPARV